MTRMRLSRRAGLLVPLALLIPALAGRTRAAAALAAAWALGRLCTLCAAEAFRAAAAREVSPRRVRGAWTGALLATALLAAAAYFYVPAVWAWLKASPGAPAVWLPLWRVGAALSLARLADEHLRAAGQGETAALSALLRGALLAASAFCGPDWMAGAAGLAALVALALACGAGGTPFAIPNAAALPCLPGAALRALCYTVPALLLLAGLWRHGAQGATAGYLLGAALLDCAATPFRRDRSESAPLHMLLALPAAALCALSPLSAQIACAAALTAFAALAGLALYAAPSPRPLLTGLLLAAACLMPWLLPAVAPFAAPLLAALSLLTLIPDARTMLLARRAGRRRAARAGR